MSETETRTEPRARKPRSDGERSRSAILHEAARLATVVGIDGLSIGRLADAVGMSKSGLFAHFRSKEELQLATIDTAGQIYNEVVVVPAMAAPTAYERLRQLAENFLRHVEDDVFPGGCFFASVAAELDTREGPVRDRAMEVVAEWVQLLEATVREAQAEGAIDGAEDPEQLVFELESYLLLANAQYVVVRDRLALDRARLALDRRLTAAATVG
jgi:AcrR family transcriptional regulator